MKKKPIFFAAGGTGGHVFPARAIASASTFDVVFITDHRGSDFFTPQEKCIVLPLPRVQLGFLGRLLFGWHLIASFFVSLYWVLRQRPAKIVGFGGYPSFPALAAGLLLGVPLEFQEQNAFLGAVNRWFLPFVRHAYMPKGVSNLPNRYKHKVTFLETPIRSDAWKVRETPFNPTAKIHLLVIGGSQGAAILARLLPEALAILSPQERARLELVQQCRAEQIADLEEAYQRLGIHATIAPFFNDIPDRLRWAHVVLARAGASTVGELLASARPAILVPLKTAADDHQTYNARSFVAKGGGWVLYEHPNRTPSFKASTLAALLQDIIHHPEILTTHHQQIQQSGYTDPLKMYGDHIGR